MLLSTKHRALPALKSACRTFVSLSSFTPRPSITKLTSRASNESSLRRQVAISGAVPRLRMITIPTVPDRDKSGATMYFDIFSRLLKERIIMLSGPVNSNMSAIIVSQLLFLEAQDPEKPIHMYINSPGGEMHAGFSIIDTMHYIRPPVSTICLGIAASMASLILAAGAKGKRYALPHAWIMVHQPSSGMEGKASDLAIQARQILRMREQANKIYQDHLSKPYTIEEIEKLVENDNYLNSQEALEIGLIDEVIKPDDNKKPHGSGGLKDSDNSDEFSLGGGPSEPLPAPAVETDPSSPSPSSSSSPSSMATMMMSAEKPGRKKQGKKQEKEQEIEQVQNGPGLTHLPNDWWRKMFEV